MAERSHYTEEEAEQILKLAARTQAGAVDRDRLLSMAEEAGLTEAQVAAAEAQFRVNHAAEYERTLFRSESRQELKSQVASYLGVNTFLVLLNLYTDGHITWAIWPLLGWGIGIMSGVASVFFSSPSEQEKQFQAWKLKRGQPQDTESVLASIAATRTLSRIEAIKELREVTGMDLNSAKEAVTVYANLHPGSFQ